MGIRRADEREFLSTYFALRVGVVASATFVFLAPILARVFEDDWPPSISDSWYTDSRAIFVMGMASASGLLIVIRGDTLTEQTFLNLAGGLGLAVAGAACWPKGPDGKSTGTFDPDVLDLNLRTLTALIVLGTILHVVRGFLPDRMIGTGWHAKRWAEILLRYTPSVLIVGSALSLFLKPDIVAANAHGWAAIVMFALLAGVSLLRTTWGIWVLGKIGDTPVNESVGTLRQLQNPPEADRLRRYDIIYAAIGIVILAALTVAGNIYWHQGPGSWIIWAEATLLLSFGAFWTVQTREAWLLLPNANV